LFFDLLTTVANKSKLWLTTVPDWHFIELFIQPNSGELPGYLVEESSPDFNRKVASPNPQHLHVNQLAFVFSTRGSP
jgi:hypothetical protein